MITVHIMTLDFLCTTGSLPAQTIGCPDGRGQRKLHPPPLQTGALECVCLVVKQLPSAYSKNVLKVRGRVAGSLECRGEKGVSEQAVGLPFIVR